MTEFKIGDKVRCIYEVIGDGILKNKIYEIEDILYNILKIKNDYLSVDLYDPTRFELVKRKIGDIWFKPEELYIHENALPIDTKQKMEKESEQKDFIITPPKGFKPFIKEDGSVLFIKETSDELIEFKDISYGNIVHCGLRRYEFEGYITGPVIDGSVGNITRDNQHGLYFFSNKFHPSIRTDIKWKVTLEEIIE